MSKTSKRRATRAKQANELDERLGPDQSRIVHFFDDGWSVRLIDRLEDAEREGVLMHLCLRRREEREQVMRHNRLMLEMREAHLANGLDFDVPYASHLLSLRDEHNHPHTTFTVDDRRAFEIEGNGGGEPKPAYVQRIRDYIAVANPAAEVIVEPHWQARHSTEGLIAALAGGEPTPSHEHARAA